ncbi:MULTISPECIES: lysylphosphatidylglycerol synthase transmembrane domain-containing protein [unclassified Yoonia]|uniref:lysylphosphatidylglycerol synthase transmembrane domain-containing protein n=1 Tax=unclassified Yoonia TaxID=2629118 RepID=UPI002AFF6851|nr:MULTISPECIES: lysylphosphatidylglycerol synthase transmembrane domain-containing protein [unclassified Yoonia]
MSERPDPLPVPRRASFGAVLRVLVTLAILALLWHLTDGPQVLALLAQSEWLWLLAALASAHGQVLLSALRWRLTAAQLDQPLRKRDAIGEYYLSQFVNLAVPGGVLGDAGRAVRQRHQAGMLRAAQAVVLERLVGQVALFAVLFGGFIVAIAVPGGLVLPDWVSDIVGWLALLVVGLVGLGAVLSRVPGPVSRATAGFLAALRLGLLARGVWPRQVGLSIAIVACNLASFAFCAFATGTDLPFVAVVTILPLILTSMMIPLSVGGWGLREGAAAAIWPVVGAQAEAGIAASIAFGLVILAASLPGVWFLLSQRRRPASASSASE